MLNRFKTNILTNCFFLLWCGPFSFSKICFTKNTCVCICSSIFITCWPYLLFVLTICGTFWQPFVHYGIKKTSNSICPWLNLPTHWSLFDVYWSLFKAYWNLLLKAFMIDSPTCWSVPGMAWVFFSCCHHRWDFAYRCSIVVAATNITFCNGSGRLQVKPGLL